MLLKILWVLDALFILGLIGSFFVEESEKGGKAAYIILFIGLIAASYKMRMSHPKVALALAGVPVAIPLLIVLFLFLAFGASAIFK